MVEKHRVIVMFLFVLLLGYLSFRILSPFLSFIIFGLLLAFMVHPVYAVLVRRMRPTFAALLVLCITLLVIIIPSIFILTDLVSQANSAYAFVREQSSSFNQTGFMIAINEFFETDVGNILSSMFSHVKSVVSSSIPRILSRTGSTLLGVLLMFLVMYYALKEGPLWYKRASALLPVRRSHRRRLDDELYRMTKALFYGQILTSALTGVVCGVIFLLFGVKSPVFWGFMMAVFAFLPFLGTPLIYVPAGLLMIMNDAWFAGISIIVLCTAVVFFFDYIFRPRIVNRGASIHPLTIIIGAIGGAIVFGFAGFLLGPLVLNLLMLLLRFESATYADDT